MLDYFKKKKLKTLLIQNYELSLKIDEEIKALSDKTDEISVLQLQDRQLAAEKVAFAYDELKKQYPDFTTINTEEDFWKYSKPKLSEGLVFTSEYSGHFHLPFSFIGGDNYVKTHLHTKFYYLEKEGATPLLREAMETNEKKLLLKRADILFPTSPKASSIRLIYICMYDRIKPHNLCVSGSSYKDIKQEVAKVAKTNIVMR